MDRLSPQVHQRLRALITDYQHQGYTVLDAPTSVDVPEVLAPYHPALLLRKGADAVLVVVRSRTALAHDPPIRDLARLIHTLPGWTLELVVMGDDAPRVAPAGARPFTRAEIVQGMAEAERLVTTGFAEAALLHAWALAEATVRLLLEDDGLSSEEYTPATLLKAAVMQGVLTREDYQGLMHALPYRNAVVHGFTMPDFAPQVVHDLLRMTHQILQTLQHLRVPACGVPPCEHVQSAVK